MKCAVLWIVRQQVQHFQSFLLAVLLYAMSEDDLVAGLVHARLEAEVAAFYRLLDCPPGEYLGHFGDVFLRVAAVDAERVQFHQLAAVVFVQAAGLPGLDVAPRTIIRVGSVAARVARVRSDSERDIRIRPDAQPVVEIEEHRGALCGRHQQVFEFSEHVRTDRVALVAR